MFDEILNFSISLLSINQRCKIFNPLTVTLMYHKLQIGDESMFQPNKVANITQNINFLILPTNVNNLYWC
jgi:hypothetical protein